MVCPLDTADVPLEHPLVMAPIASEPLVYPLDTAGVPFEHPLVTGPVASEPLVYPLDTTPLERPLHSAPTGLVIPLTEEDT